MLPPIPTKLGRYEVVDEIGKGAMGVVYLARDLLIGRLVALKTIRIGYLVKNQEMARFRIRFMREAQSAGILTHPNIVTIHDVVEASDEGPAFIAMEYVRGTNLKLMLQGEQPLSLAGVLDVIAQVGEALDYAHANRVVHRDVKPANILITSEGKVKITDFGIARLDSSSLTQEGQILGTPNYMAPEQIQGKEVGPRADLFSLGVVLYEMLTRHKPFQGENLTVVSHRIVYDRFTPPGDYVENFPPGLEGILAKALDKDPYRRYQNAKEMVADLRSLFGTLGGDGQKLSVMWSLVQTPPQGTTLDFSWTQAGDYSTQGCFEFDVFISHASEDKATFVDPLARRLRERNLCVWYDSFTLKLGDSLRDAIDYGLSRSRFGVVIFSQNFCRKDWTKRELEGLLAMERNGRKVILPLWHEVTREEVARFSPMLADRYAISSRQSLEEIVGQILAVVRVA
ncbi:MAG TPA: protein kinase [Thermoanaerobaculia bacterium]